MTHSSLAQQVGLRRCYAESCIYMRHDGKDVTLLGLSVDDILIVITSPSDIDLLKKQLKSQLTRVDIYQWGR